MATIEMSCPGCKSPLRLPEAAVGRKGRCNGCGLVFLIDEPSIRRRDAMEDAICDWLSDGADEPQEAPPPRQPAEAVVYKKPPEPASPPPPPPAKTFHIHLDHVDEMGAFFRFSPALLCDEHFRLIFPRQCLICGQPTHLMVHVVAWSNPSHRAQKRVDEQRSVRRLDQLADVDGANLLKHLPRQDHLDEPYNLPMPYYVCDGCSSVGAVMSVVQPAANGSGDDCMLGIASLVQAEAFATAARGPDWPALADIRSRRGQFADPWNNLPLAIRIRLGQWYKPQPGEQFQMYLRDMEFSRAEAGLAGLVATDRRIIHRRGVSLTDLPYREHITLQFKKTGDNVELLLRAAEKNIRLLAMESQVKQLREVMTKFRNA
ncbi:MAG: hypothetical protein FWE88_01830 [Phycisphaerae bacterium]|nr:hypothetical protein [Phycisphaerae bacterium]